jgi:hypothetical protein
MFTSTLETLETRRLMSVTTMVNELGLTAGDDAPGVTVPMNYSAKATTTPTFNAKKFVGNFREKTDSLFFATTMKITSVDKQGNVTGFLTIPWIVSNAVVKGKITSDRRFKLKFEENWNESEGAKGRYNGRLSSDFNRVSGNMAYTFGHQPASTVKGFDMVFGRKKV